MPPMANDDDEEALAPFMQKIRVVVPSWDRVLLQDGLYVEHNLDEPVYVTINGFRFGRLSLDAYCIWCKSKSVFRNIAYQTVQDRAIMLSRQGMRGQPRDSVTPSEEDDFELILECTRVPKHRISFYFVVVGTTLTKVGQFPSHADLAVGDLQDFSGVLDQRWMRELKRGIGLTAHGATIGGFVYVRRVFEHLIARAHDEAVTLPGWDEGTYTRSRVSEKIQLLKEQLPALLVENSTMYGILSLGVHELTEDECADHFPVVREGIELILGRLADDKNRSKREAALSSAIGKITSKLGKSDQGTK